MENDLTTGTGSQMRFKLTSLILIFTALLVTSAQAQSSDWSKRALARIANPPLGLPPVPEPKTNIATAEKITLGRKLFFDRRLSGKGIFSCAVCHIPEQGFVNNNPVIPAGSKGGSDNRNNSTMFNVAYNRTMFHDGRDFSLETQIYGPFLGKAEMANPSIGWLLQTIAGLDDYWGQFERVFGQPVNTKNLGEALATYQRSIISANSPFDKWQYGNQKQALGADAIRGLKLFKGKAGCVRCHLIGKDSALFTDHKFHNTGAGRKGNPDEGRKEVTGIETDINRFKTPILRNIALTAPYMHDGNMKTLKEVVAFYNKGSSKTLKPLGLNETEQADLVAFLNQLTGDNVAELIEEAKN